MNRTVKVENARHSVFERDTNYVRIAYKDVPTIRTLNTPFGKLTVFVRTRVFRVTLDCFFKFARPKENMRGQKILCECTRAKVELGSTLIGPSTVPPWRVMWDRIPSRTEIFPFWFFPSDKLNVILCCLGAAEANICSFSTDSRTEPSDRNTRTSFPRWKETTSNLLGNSYCYHYGKRQLNDVTVRFLQGRGGWWNIVLIDNFNSPLSHLPRIFFPRKTSPSPAPKEESKRKEKWVILRQNKRVPCLQLEIASMSFRLSRSSLFFTWPPPPLLVKTFFHPPYPYLQISPSHTTSSRMDGS